MKRKLICSAFVFVMLMSLCACGADGANPTATVAPTASPSPIVTNLPTDDIMPDVDDGIIDDNNNKNNDNGNGPVNGEQGRPGDNNVPPNDDKVVEPGSVGDKNNDKNNAASTDKPAA